ncbi:hypothetical protein MHM84_01035 [Halomonas sp. McH1-25]|uniref:hypothetical protein n=1 Tax=unclassified Halomonas TaxID=2609666 RepID=UPI001EF5E226|nr:MULTISPECIES: hypothetical protein [unclassified Halomonas]MCG7598366.1 hypothetical protein [Halomonas sp. McH1-25]MCP1342692.1 hypothetical protein [Halomonas sp. FL8]MCP1363092.1 hypothetical protein [Halomonas sp. BBD45]MCP1367070.1 hypothetical protein [Halomonas sp. BBD48]
MKERPILFNGEMVRAILDGRKTQTRRVVKPKVEELIRCHAGVPGEECEVSFRYNNWFDDNGTAHDPEWLCYASEYPEEGIIPIGQCPYGEPGDRLWVREGILQSLDSTTLPSGECESYWTHEKVEYLADTPQPQQRFLRPDSYSSPWMKRRPSIHMPRWASRITLEIVSVRVERLQEISEADAKAEGVHGEQEAADAGLSWHDKPRRAFRFLWQSINGADSWDANPWVWVVEFKRIDEARAAA